MMYPTQLSKLLLQCPTVVNIKDNKGEQPIHKAVQQGIIGNVQVLLDHNSEIDPTSDAGMTPLMLACYYGYLNIMHLLIEKGANVSAVDSEGCGMVHYAVDGGQVTSIQYLTEVCGVSTHTRDHRLQTSLFKACSQGNIEMLNYLLRKDRSEVAAEDVMGNTALHVAAEKEHSWTCWRLLEVGGLELLHKTNKDSLTPLDVAIQNAPFKNSPAVKMLKYYTSLGSHTGPVAGPRVTWYAHLMLPFAGYLAVFLIIPFTNYRGVVALALLFGLLKTIQCHNPRIKSYCRWPNPVYAGMFGAGIFYTLVCMYHEILYYIFMKYQWFTVMCVCQHVALLTVYFRLLLTEPETCTSSSVDEDTGHAHSIMDIAEGKVPTLSYCQQCELVKPRYVHHCRLCNCCYQEMDHHCLLLNKCVGRGTHRLFVLFLLICATNMVTFLMLSSWYLYTEFSIFVVDSRDIMVAIFNYYVFVWTMLLGNAVSLGWVIGMLLTQVWMISNGYLIASMLNAHAKLTYRQCIKNLVAFALGNHVERDNYEACPSKAYGIAPV